MNDNINDENKNSNKNKEVIINKILKIIFFSIKKSENKKVIKKTKKDDRSLLK